MPVESTNGPDETLSTTDWLGQCVNVFWLDESPELAAGYHCDQHVNKMLLEAAQVLCTAARENEYERDFLYQATHTDHPVTRWATESRANWLELRDHAEALNAEFK